MKKAFLLTTHALISFVVISTLVFSNWTFPAPKAEAGGLDGRATEWTQRLNNTELVLSTTKGTITAANTTVSAGADTIILTKENLLDGIAWAIAKQMVSSMTRSLINWINSGFQGDPAFITDLRQHLLNAIDNVAGTFIQSLGGIGSFVCSPFRLDVQAALRISYQQSRTGMPSGPSACKLSDIANNITTFLDGATDNWQQWFEVTANPQNTPYGAFLEAEAKLNARLVNAAGEEITLANWSSGFLSKKVCTGPNNTNCTIVTPGEVISEALTFQLSTGQMTLIEADEINEIIGALINQLMLQVVNGINGLLGLGGNSDYTSYDFNNPTGTSTQSYLDAMIAENLGLTSTTTLETLLEQRALEQELLNLATTTFTLGTNALAANKVYVADARIASSSIVTIVTDASSTAATAVANIAIIDNLIARFNAGSTTASEVEAVITEFIDKIADGTLSSEADIGLKEVEWGRIVNPTAIADMPIIITTLFSQHQHRFFPLLQHLLSPASGQQLTFSNTPTASCSAVINTLNATVAGTNDAAFRFQQGTQSYSSGDNCALYADTGTSQVVDATTNISSNSFLLHAHSNATSLDFTAIGGPRVSRTQLGPSAYDLVAYCEYQAENPSMRNTALIYNGGGGVWQYSVSDATCNRINSSDLEKRLFLLQASAYEGCRILSQSQSQTFNRDSFSESYLYTAAHLLFPGRTWGMNPSDPIDIAYEYLIVGGSELSASGYSDTELTECLTQTQTDLGFSVSAVSSSNFCSTFCPPRLTNSR